MYLGAKIEEEPLKIRDVINVAYRLELSENCYVWIETVNNEKEIIKPLDIIFPD